MYQEAYQNKNVEETSSYHEVREDHVPFFHDYRKSFPGPSTAQSGVCLSKAEVGQPHAEA